jgi:hypothetical protein
MAPDVGATLAYARRHIWSLMTTQPDAFWHARRSAHTKPLPFSVSILLAHAIKKDRAGGGKTVRACSIDAFGLGEEARIELAKDAMTRISGNSRLVRIDPLDECTEIKTEIGREAFPRLPILLGGIGVEAPDVQKILLETIDAVERDETILPAGESDSRSSAEV